MKKTEAPAPERIDDSAGWRAPLAATVYELEKLRCNLCWTVYRAAAPPAAGVEKYDESAARMIAMLRYGSGFS
jgi:transposase